MLPRRLVLGLALLAPLLAAAPALAATAQDAAAMVKGLEREAIALASPSLSMSQKEQRFRAMLHRSFDMPAVEQFVLGRNLQSATPQQRQAFSRLFEDVTTRTWARRFNDYQGERLDVTNVRAAPGGFEVDSLIQRPRGEPTQVQWRLQDGRGGLRVVDIIVNGVSMAITYRQEYASVIRNTGGIDGLLGSMQQQLARAQ